MCNIDLVFLMQHNSLNRNIDLFRSFMNIFWKRILRNTKCVAFFGSVDEKVKKTRFGQSILKNRFRPGLQFLFSLTCKNFECWFIFTKTILIVAEVYSGDDEVWRFFWNCFFKLKKIIKLVFLFFYMSKSDLVL